MQNNKHILIIGGGIGGLTTAIALRRVGIEATVYEGVGEMGEVGAGLTLWTNAVRVLEKLGMGDALAAIGSPIKRGGIRTWRGEVLAETFIDELARRFGTTTTAVHRADLQAMLLQTLEEGVVRLGARCTGFRQDDTGVWAQFADGSEAYGDALIGADGIHSLIRAQLFGKEPPRYAGYTAWRGVTSFASPHLPAAVIEWWGCGQRFGMVHLNAGRVYWFAVHNAVEGETDEPIGSKRKLLALFKGWHEPVEALIKATDEAAILHNDIYDRKPVRHWGKERVTLLGDAAHAMTPNVGQGACQAIEDALVLAQNLKETNEIPTALRNYETRRMRRANGIVSQSWIIGRVAQIENPLACQLRDTVMKLLPASLQLKQFERIVGYEI